MGSCICSTRKTNDCKKTINNTNNNNISNSNNNGKTNQCEKNAITDPTSINIDTTQQQQQQQQPSTTIPLPQTTNQQAITIQKFFPLEYLSCDALNLLNGKCDCIEIEGESSNEIKFYISASFAGEFIQFKCILNSQHAK